MLHLTSFPLAQTKLKRESNEQRDTRAKKSINHKCTRMHDMQHWRMHESAWVALLFRAFFSMPQQKRLQNAMQRKRWREKNASVCWNGELYCTHRLVLSKAGERVHKDNLCYGWHMRNFLVVWLAEERSVAQSGRGAIQLPNEINEILCMKIWEFVIA